MPSSDQPEQFLSTLEEYLDKGPQGDNQQLKDVVVWLTQLDSKANGAAAENIVQLLGTAVGHQHTWQLPFRGSGILAHVVQNLDLSSTPAALAKQYLRVIGNCVADNDENRELVTRDYEKLVACLAEGELTPTALAVMFNLSNDFAPARVKAAELRLDNILSEYLVTSRIPEAAVDYAIELLTWTTEKLIPAQLVDSTSLKVFENVLSVALEDDEDHQQEYLAILVHYLQDPQFQQKAATPKTLQNLVDLMFDFEAELTPEEHQEAFQELGTHSEPGKETSEETNVILLVRLVGSISAISASDAFVQNFTPQSPLLEKIKSQLGSLAPYPSTVCACVMLGNLATSDQVCIDMVADLGLHSALIDILSSRREPALLYAAAGFMRHLTFPEVNRAVLGGAGLIGTCCHLLTNEDPSVRGEAAAILCKLVTNNFPNIEKSVYEPISNAITPAEVEGVELPEHPTILFHVVTQALAPSGSLPSTTMKNPMIELGRTLVAILRYLRRSNREEDVDAVARHMLKTPAIGRPIARLVRQRFYADARSEGLLGLGLMAQSQEGAVCVVEEMKADSGLLGAIKEFAVEQKGSQSDNATAGRDYQNAVVLLHGLATNAADAIDTSLKNEIESLQSDLGRLMV